MHTSDIKTVLDKLYAGRSSRHLANDPLSFCYAYKDPADREVAAVISSAFAYGAGFASRRLTDFLARTARQHRVSAPAELAPV